MLEDDAVRRRQCAHIEGVGFLTKIHGRQKGWHSVDDLSRVFHQGHPTIFIADDQIDIAVAVHQRLHRAERRGPHAQIRGFLRRETIYRWGDITYETKTKPFEARGKKEQELLAGVAEVVDVGELPGPASTVIDFTGDEPKVLREGAVSTSVLSAIASGEN